MSQKQINGISQHQLADAAGCSWQKIQKFVALGEIKPLAVIGGRFVFSENDVARAKECIAEAKQADESKYRATWTAMPAKERAQYSTFSAFVAYHKNTSSVQSFQGGRSVRAVGRVA